MTALFECLEDLTGSRSGQGLVEYGLIMVMAVILIVFAMSTLGADISEPMNNVANAF
jgi:Flp pilus assembly pilin Flp